nr:hypothetical protein CFP56_31427 [Quercus suber]
MDFRFPKKGKEKMKTEGMSVVKVLDLEVLQSLGLRERRELGRSYITLSVSLFAHFRNRFLIWVFIVL